MKTAGLLFALGALLALTGCSDPRSQAEETLRQIGAPFLRSEAASFYKQFFASPDNQSSLPKLDSWPPAFRRFQPLRVRVYSDGFGLALLEGRRSEEGLYVVPQGMEDGPREGRNAHFQKIEDGIYWYQFTE